LKSGVSSANKEAITTFQEGHRVDKESLKSISEVADQYAILANEKNNNSNLMSTNTSTKHDALKHKVPYNLEYPSEENALSLFDGEWTCAIPGYTGPGNIGLFADHRIEWLIKEIGVMNDMNILELGPLEAGHTYMLEKSGANVLAIEANIDSFLRCLIVKNLLDLKSKFILGDFTKGLGQSNSYELVVASGVLYHMTDPISLLEQISQVTNQIFIWTHYFEPDIQKWNPAIQGQVGLKWKVSETKRVNFNNKIIRIVPQTYGEALGWDGFCGGPETFSNWIYKDDIILILKELGYRQIKVNFDQPDHPNGPAFCLIATR